MEKLPGRGWITGLLLLVGLNAVVAGFGFIGTPDGSAIGIPQDWLNGTPFKDYLIPGIILFAMGLLALLAAVLEFRNNQFAWAWAGVCGAGFVIWIVVQSALMGSFRHPAQTILQAVVLLIGVALIILALRQKRALQLRRNSPR